MKIILFVILYFTISLSTLKADNHIKTNPITTPMEPKGLWELNRDDPKNGEFSKSGFDAKTFELFAFAAAGMK